MTAEHVRKMENSWDRDRGQGAFWHILNIGRIRKRCRFLPVGGSKTFSAVVVRLSHLLHTMVNQGFWAMDNRQFSIRVEVHREFSAANAPYSL